METPFYSMIGRGTTQTVRAQLIEEELNAVVNNAQNEGFAFPADADTSPIVDGAARRDFYTQIFTKSVVVTGSQQANDTVSVTGKKELAEQLALRGMELKRDVEWSCVGDKSPTNNDNGVTITGTPYTGGGGAGNAGTGAVTGARYITDAWNQTVPSATATAISTTALNNVARQLYQTGGLSYNMGNAQVKNANVFLMSPVNKAGLDDALDMAAGTRRDIGNAEMLNHSYKKYGTSFGDFAIVPDQFASDGQVLGFNPMNWKWVTLRPMHTQEIAKVGDAERRQIVMEGTLIHRHTDASAKITGITTSR